MRYLLEQPQVLSSLPENFVFLMMILKCACNLELLDAYGSEGKPIVFARVKSSRESVLDQGRPSLYAPVVVAQLICVGHEN